MILSDFLCRQIEDDSDLHEIIPISINIREILQENYLKIVNDTYMVQTRSQAKAQANAPNHIKCKTSNKKGNSPGC